MVNSSKGKGRGANFRRPVEERHRVAARKLVNGAAIMPTLLEAGYSDSVARRGRAIIDSGGPLGRAIEQTLAPLAYAPGYDPEQRRNIVVNKLLKNIALDRDAVTTSLTTLARIENMLQPEATTVVAVQVNAAPSGRGAEWLDTEPDPE